MNKKKAKNDLSNKPILHTFNQYEIKLNYHSDVINIQIQNNYTFYESNFTLEHLHLHKLLISNITINDMFNFINCLIVQKNIEIIENENNLKLILISTLSNHSNVELLLNKKSILSNEIIEKLINDIKYIKDENENLKKIIKSIEENNIKLKKNVELIEKENNKINEIEKRIKKLERFNKDKKIIQLKKSNLQNINIIESHTSFINSVSIFPSGNIISVSADKSIKIYDINLNILQNIKNAHDNSIAYVEVKDENNFITCSADKSIKLWIKKENKFKINKIINNAHDDKIIKVIYCLNGDLISCSHDNKIKIWKEDNNNNYEVIKILLHSKWINSILFLEDKNILISAGEDGTKIWDFNEINKKNYLNYFNETFSGWHGGLCKLDEDRIIVQGNNINTLKVISLLNKKIIKVINIPFLCFGIYLIEDKGIFLVGGRNKDIMVYRNDNYECIQIIQNAHDDSILGFIELKDGTIISYSSDKKIKVWSF